MDPGIVRGRGSVKRQPSVKCRLKTKEVTAHGASSRRLNTGLQVTLPKIPIGDALASIKLRPVDARASQSSQSTVGAVNPRWKQTIELRHRKPPRSNEIVRKSTNEDPAIDRLQSPEVDNNANERKVSNTRRTSGNVLALANQFNLSASPRTSVVVTDDVKIFSRNTTQSKDDKSTISKTEGLKSPGFRGIKEKFETKSPTEDSENQKPTQGRSFQKQTSLPVQTPSPSYSPKIAPKVPKKTSLTGPAGKESPYDGLPQGRKCSSEQGFTSVNDTQIDELKAKLSARLAKVDNVPLASGKARKIPSLAPPNSSKPDPEYVRSPLRPTHDSKPVVKTKTSQLPPKPSYSDKTVPTPPQKPVSPYSNAEAENLLPKSATGMKTELKRPVAAPRKPLPPLPSKPTGNDVTGGSQVGKKTDSVVSRDSVYDDTFIGFVPPDDVSEGDSGNWSTSVVLTDGSTLSESTGDDLEEAVGWVDEPATAPTPAEQCLRKLSRSSKKSSRIRHRKSADCKSRVRRQVSPKSRFWSNPEKSSLKVAQESAILDAAIGVDSEWETDSDGYEQVDDQLASDVMLSAAAQQYPRVEDVTLDDAPPPPRPPLPASRKTKMAPASPNDHLESPTSAAHSDRRQRPARPPPPNVLALPGSNTNPLFAFTIELNESQNLYKRRQSRSRLLRPKSNAPPPPSPSPQESSISDPGFEVEVDPAPPELPERTRRKTESSVEETHVHVTPPLPPRISNVKKQLSPAERSPPTPPRTPNAKTGRQLPPRPTEDLHTVVPLEPSKAPKLPPRQPTVAVDNVDLNGSANSSTLLDEVPPPPPHHLVLPKRSPKSPRTPPARQSNRISSTTSPEPPLSRTSHTMLSTSSIGGNYIDPLRELASHPEILQLSRDVRVSTSSSVADGQPDYLQLMEEDFAAVDEAVSTSESAFNLIDEPLYQIYHAGDFARSMLEQQDGDHDIASDELEPTDIYQTFEELTSISQEIKEEERLTRLHSLVKTSNGFRTLWCEMPEVVSSGFLEVMSTEEKQLQETMFEIITSEMSYLKSLNLLISSFLEAPEFSEEKMDAILDKRSKHTLFSNIVAVRDVSKKVMVHFERVWKHSVILAGHFLAVLGKLASAEFDVYINYCKNQRFQERILKKLQEKPEFVQSLSELEKNPACQCLPLHSFLNLPMQRITRLPLLVDTVFRKLKDNTEEYAAASEALMSLQAVARQCNEAARQMENIEQMIHIKDILQFKNVKPLPLISQSRSLVKKGPLKRIYKKPVGPFGKRKENNFFLFLFNDLLIFTKKKNEDQYVVIDYAPRIHVEATYIDEEAYSHWLPSGVPGGCKNLFVMALLENHESKDAEFIFACESQYLSSWEPTEFEEEYFLRLTKYKKNKHRSVMASTRTLDAGLMIWQSERLRWVEAVTPVQQLNDDERIYETWDCPQVQALHRYFSSEPDELSMEESDIINVYKKMGDGWYEGERIRDGQRGWFPSNHTVEIQSAHSRARNLRQKYRLLTLSKQILDRR